MFLLMRGALRQCISRTQKTAARVFGADPRLKVVRIIGKNFYTTIPRQGR